MVTVRLFRSQTPSGFIGFDDIGHRMMPTGILSDDLVNAIRRELESGSITGWIFGYYWYRQATPYCPMDVVSPVGHVAKLCPCNDPVCGLDALS